MNCYFVEEQKKRGNKKRKKRNKWNGEDLVGKKTMRKNK